MEEGNMERLSRITTLILALAAGAACGRHPGPASPPPRAVRLQRVAPAGGPSELRYSATLQPREQVPLAFKVGGYVRGIAQRAGADGRTRPLQQGDVVRAGTELARLGDDGYRQAVERARAQRAGAAATLSRARSDADRAQKLYDAQSLTRVDYDAARTGLEVASAQHTAAAAELESASTSLRDCVLRAPWDALVLSRGVEAGALAAPGTVAFVLADVSQMKAVFGVPERVARSLSVGQPLELSLDARTAPATGIVTAVAPSADAQSRVFAVEVSLSNPDGQLRAGTIATVRVPTGAAAAPARPAVPLNAVVRSPSRRDG